MLILGAVGACGDDEDPGSGPESGSSPSASEPTEPTPTADPDAATGQEFTGPGFRFRGPEGWVVRLREDGEPLQLVVGSADGNSLNEMIVESTGDVTFSDVRSPAPDELEDFRFLIKDGRMAGVVDWAGQRAYHFTGDDPELGHYERFGVLWQGRHVSIEFGLERMPPAQMQEIISSVEASWEWTKP